MDVFNTTQGSQILRKPLGIIAMLFFVFLTAKVMASKGLVMGIMMVILPGAIIFINRVFNNPRLGLMSVFVVEFFVLGLGRYIQGVPMGLAVDGLLIVTYIALIFKHFYEKVD